MTSTTTPNAIASAGITVGSGTPLTAAYCAERAAAAIAKAEETAASHEYAAVWLGAAARWQALAEAMATNAPMNRPKNDDDNPRRR